MSCANKIDPALHQTQKPPWIKVRLPSNPVFFSTKALISDLRLHTVCESAQCPNRWECWSQGTATMMIAGERCTRACGFCAVTTAKPFALEEDEPQRVAEAVRRMGLKHVVVTAVARDDLKDGGANHFARTIAAIREMDPLVIVEVLVPDFHAQTWCIQIVLDAAPDIFNHNMETVERLTPLVRSRAKYRTSLEVLQQAKKLAPKIVTKSGVMLGLGEKEPELFQVMDALREVGCQVLTMGQYLRPSERLSLLARAWRDLCGDPRWRRPAFARRDRALPRGRRVRARRAADRHSHERRARNAVRAPCGQSLHEPQDQPRLRPGYSRYPVR